MSDLPSSEPTFLDGNAAAGPLRDVFSVDLTSAVGTCAGCGDAGPVGGVRLYSQAPGLVGRCPGCEEVLFTLVRGEQDTFLSMKGFAMLRFPTAG
ncbi:DUF6510 family protein [Motilibacter aurantiacus]|uniref:DUF6510 family protein n=1 Tax=Motilibacter aurantiacus TaxID=2714955 RepID=UPI001408279A|nr:DUF6510 family protein [Motilibacter aurantiacus]NHC43662.1 hypothetical protein [Motilibacter aurantiacus]